MAEHVTECPSCHTRFRVDEEVLSASEGQVRCGRCQHVFNALNYLQLSVAPVVTREEPRLQIVTSWVRPESVKWVYDWSQCVTFWVGPEGLQSPPDPLYDVLEVAVEKLRIQSPSSLNRPIASPSSFVKTEYPEPAWIPKYDGSLLKSRSTRLRLLRAAVYIWCGILAMQFFWVSRSMIAYHIPESRLFLSELSDFFGTSLLPVNKSIHWHIEQASLEKPIDKKLDNQLSLKILLRQNHSYQIAWPILILKLTDINDQPLIERHFLPHEYLPYTVVNGVNQKIRESMGISGPSEVNVQLPLAVPKNTVGFRVVIKE